VKFEVDLGSLPDLLKHHFVFDEKFRPYYQGYEVTANFHTSMDNNKTFWTDSNGLEMQKRVLNYRPTWDIEKTNYADALQNITANYYPINSAIAMRDEKTGK
jgi:hypothetical protein